MASTDRASQKIPVPWRALHRTLSRMLRDFINSELYRERHCSAAEFVLSERENLLTSSFKYTTQNIYNFIPLFHERL